MPNSSGADRTASDDASDQDDLRDSLSQLSQLATGRLGLENTLTQVARFVVRAIPGADGAGLTLLEEGRSDTIVATAPFVSEIDDIQSASARDRVFPPPRKGSR